MNNVLFLCDIYSFEWLSRFWALPKRLVPGLSSHRGVRITFVGSINHNRTSNVGIMRASLDEKLFTHSNSNHSNISEWQGDAVDGKNKIISVRNFPEKILKSNKVFCWEINEKFFFIFTTYYSVGLIWVYVLMWCDTLIDNKHFSTHFLSFFQHVRGNCVQQGPFSSFWTRFSFHFSISLYLRNVFKHFNADLWGAFNSEKYVFFYASEFMISLALLLRCICMCGCV